MQWFPVQTRRFLLGKRRIPLGKRALMGSESFFIFLSAQTVKYLNMFYIRMMYVISTFLPYFFLCYFKFFLKILNLGEIFQNLPPVCVTAYYRYW